MVRIIDLSVRHYEALIQSVSQSVLDEVKVVATVPDRLLMVVVTLIASVMVPGVLLRVVGVVLRSVPRFMVRSVVV